MTVQRPMREVIAMAIQMFLNLGLKEFQIDIGQVEFFKAIIKEAVLSDENTEEVHRLIDQKDMLSLERLLKELPISEDVRNLLYKLPQLYGDSSVLNEAMEISRNAEARAGCREHTTSLPYIKGLRFSELYQL